MTVKIHQRLRPVRLAFIIDAHEPQSLLEAITFNTCLWGGLHNAIIPLFEQEKLPSLLSHLSPGEIVQKYVDVFEPDYIVSCGCDSSVIHSACPNLGIDILEKSAVLGNERGIEFGTSVLDFFQWLYFEEFQFTSRQPRPAVHYIGSDLFSSAFFGMYPTGDVLASFGKMYEHVFCSKQVQQECASFIEVVDTNTLTPIRAGVLDIRVQSRGDFGHRVLLIDEESVADIAEFWNLRALGIYVRPAPLRWFSEIVAFTQDRITKELNQGRPMMTSFGGWATVCGTANVEGAKWNEFISGLGQLPPGAISSFTGYRAPWEDKRGLLNAGSMSRDVAFVLNKHIEFEILSPEFIADRSTSTNPRWANVLQIDGVWEGCETGLVLPDSLENIDKLFHSHEPDLHLDSEGLIIASSYFQKQFMWKMPSNFELIQHVLSSLNIGIKVNDKGSIVYEIVRNLGGLMGIQAIANIELLALLNSTTRGAVNFEGSVIPFAKCWGLLQKINSNELHFAKNHLQCLIDKKVLRLGLQLRCSRCNQFGWYSLDQLSDMLNCRRCLQTFGFPATDPEKQKWSYHTQGPFSTADYAMGSYSVVLALRFLIPFIHASASWVPNVQVKIPCQPEREADFIIYWQEVGKQLGSPVSMLIGEAKSKGPFDSDDRDRAEFFKKLFPKAFFVFATLATELVEEDAEWLREFSATAKTIILTGSDLTAEIRPELWRDTADEHGLVHGERSQLLNLSRLTCRTHLQSGKSQGLSG